MHGDDIHPCKITDAVKGILDAVPSGLAARHYTVGHGKAMLTAQVMPQPHLLLGQGHDDLHVRFVIKRTVPIFPKSLDGVHQYGLAHQSKELLGHRSAKSGTRTTGDNDCNRFHVIYSLVQRLPSAVCAQWRHRHVQGTKLMKKKYFKGMKCKKEP